MTKRKPSPKYQQVVESLRQDIAAQVYQPGDRLPSENELAIARYQGRHIAEIANKLFGGEKAPAR